MLYSAYQCHTDAAWPVRTAAAQWLGWFGGPAASGARTPPGKRFAALCELTQLMQATHARPSFDLHEVTVRGEAVAVREQLVDRTPYASLLRFAKPGIAPQPKLLVVAPMSGHFATLLRDTVRVALPDHDVHITDWHNAREVPLAAGRFGLDEYIEHLMRFVRAMHAGEGAGTHVLAVCQPTVAALAATALMAEDDDPATPRSLTLMAGPIDCRVQPTEVNRLATAKPMAWFERNLISSVPWRYAGAGRRVYPGFVQLCAFMQMNMKRHMQSLRQLVEHRLAGEHAEADALRRFYEEYFAVADLPAEFYLETVEQVFQTFALARGELRWRGRRVQPAAIRRTPLLTIEGERDDICSVGQTLAAHALCSSLRSTWKQHLVQPGVGHYGVFSGRKWASQVYPMVRDLVHRTDAVPVAAPNAVRLAVA
jgi:poly(3-hydroxybutyrate) depolymerase